MPDSEPQPLVVLVVDDNADILEAYARILREGGMEPLTASNGKAALEIAFRLRPVLVLVDQQGGGSCHTGARTCFGRRLAGNEKLKKLARMVGRMKLSALAIRKKVFERSSEELLEVEQGDALHRLLPHELLSLHHPILRKDFYRRFLDQELIQYSLRGIEEKGKGPMIVCLDGSGSMAGDKIRQARRAAQSLVSRLSDEPVLPPGIGKIIQLFWFLVFFDQVRVPCANEKDQIIGEPVAALHLVRIFRRFGNRFVQKQLLFV